MSKFLPSFKIVDFQKVNWSSLVAVFSISSIICFLGCSQAPNTSSFTSPSIQDPKAQKQGALEISPAAVTLRPAAEQAFTVIGGAQPYSFSISPSGGSIDASGKYTAPSGMGGLNAVVTVTDAQGASATAAVMVLYDASAPNDPNAFVISPTSATLKINEILTFAATGGKAPYTFSISSGTGSINSSSGAYTAPATAGSATITAKDATGKMITAEVTVKSGSDSTPTNYTLATVYSLYLGGGNDHIFGLTREEGGYTPEGGRFKVIDQNIKNVPNTTMLYRCRTTSGRPHFISVDPNCEGHVYDGTLGYIFTSQVPGTQQLFRYASPTTGDHYNTLVKAQLNGSGYSLEGSLGWVFPHAPVNEYFVIGNGIYYANDIKQYCLDTKKTNTSGLIYLNEAPSGYSGGGNCQ